MSGRSMIFTMRSRLSMPACRASDGCSKGSTDSGADVHSPGLARSCIGRGSLTGSPPTPLGSVASFSLGSVQVDHNFGRH
jgi:hypothetical protein